MLSVLQIFFWRCLLQGHQCPEMYSMELDLSSWCSATFFVELHGTLQRHPKRSHRYSQGLMCFFLESQILYNEKILQEIIWESSNVVCSFVWWPKHLRVASLRRSSGCPVMSSVGFRLTSALCCAWLWHHHLGWQRGNCGQETMVQISVSVPFHRLQLGLNGTDLAVHTATVTEQLSELNLPSSALTCHSTRMAM